MAVLIGGYPTLSPALVPHPIQARGRVGGKETVIRMHCFKNYFFFLIKTRQREEKMKLLKSSSHQAVSWLLRQRHSVGGAHKHAFTNGGEMQLHQLGCVFTVTAACSLGVLTRVQVCMSLCMCMCESCVLYVGACMRMRVCVA